MNEIPINENDNLLQLLIRVADAREESERNDADGALALYGAELRLARKVDAYAHVLAHFKGQIAASDLEIDRLRDRIGRFGRAIARLEQMAELALSLTENKRLEGEHTTLVLRENPASTQIHNYDTVPDEYMKTELTLPLPAWKKILNALGTEADAIPIDKCQFSPYKDKIKKAIKAGTDVPGCHLEAGFRVECK